MKFQTEHGAFPTIEQPCSPFVHLYVISQHTHPSIMLRYLAHRFVDSIRIGHISLPLLAHSQNLLTSLQSIFPGVDMPHSVTEGSFVLVQRETVLKRFELLTQGNDVRLEEDHLTVSAVEAMLRSGGGGSDRSAQVNGFTALHIPRLTYSNFFPLCYPSYLSGKSSASTEHSPQAHRECLILFVKSQAEAHQLGMDIFREKTSPTNAENSEDSTPTSSSLPRHIQLGWMDPRAQSRLHNFFVAAAARQAQAGKGRGSVPIQAVLLRASTSSFTVYPKMKMTAPDLLAWALHVSQTSSVAARAAGGAAKAGAGDKEAPFPPVLWVDGKLAGGLPYPVEESGSWGGGDGVLRTFASVFTTPLRWMQAALGLTPSEEATSGGSSIVLILIVVFTSVFLLSTSSMLRFVSD